MESNETPLTPLQAWADFSENVLPTIWDGLSDKDKNTLINARRDSEGKRRDARNGNVLNLGASRIESLLSKFAPGRYRIEKHIVFYLNE